MNVPLVGVVVALSFKEKKTFQRLAENYVSKNPN